MHVGDHAYSKRPAKWSPALSDPVRRVRQSPVFPYRGWLSRSAVGKSVTRMTRQSLQNSYGTVYIWMRTNKKPSDCLTFIIWINIFVVLGYIPEQYKYLHSGGAGCQVYFGYSAERGCISWKKSAYFLRQVHVVMTSPMTSMLFKLIFLSIHPWKFPEVGSAPCSMVKEGH